MTLGQLILRTERRLRAARLHYGHGTDNARDEAAFLVLRGLGLPFDADLNRPADPRRVEHLIVKRIESRIPAAYLLNEAWLGGLRFHVDRRVIVPRSHIAELLAERLQPWLRAPVRRILDLCTGSACLAVLAARAFPRASVDAVDISAAALAVAKKNVGRRRIRLIRSDLFGSVRERYDLIISNPPYVNTVSMRRLPAEYRHEPGIALAGGKAGLDFVTRILADAPRHMTERALLVCEIGANRRALERAFPRTEFLWPRDEVFILERARVAGATAGARYLRGKVG